MKTRSLLRNKSRYAATDAMVGLFSVVLAAAVVASLYFARDFLIPLALAALLAFILSPLVGWIERGVGRVIAVSSVAILIFCTLVVVGWAVTRQTLDLANKLPDYRANIVAKIRSMELSKDGPIKRLSQLISEIESEVPTLASQSQPSGKDLPSQSTVNVQGRENTASLNGIRLVVFPLLDVLGTGGIVIVLVIFMLLKREDLRGRLIKIMGQGRISSTSRAMEDAADRVSRFLATQLIVNLSFGAAFGGGLYLIGMPNAFLWGVLAAALRFVPYVGVWMAALCPVVLAIAISPGWGMVLLTIGIFLVLEIVTANVLEPLVYRSSTGISSLALIVAAIFWTWLWGPVGLLLSTPLTVCFAVMGRHVPRLSFFSTLLANEDALTASEECYHRLLVGNLVEADKVVDTYVSESSVTSLYDSVLIPTIALAEMDYQRGELEDAQRLRILKGVREIVDDLGVRRPLSSRIEGDRLVADDDSVALIRSDCRVICVATRGERDEVAGSMLAQLLRQQGFDAETEGNGRTLQQLSLSIQEFRADVICVSVVPPTLLIHARHLCSQLRANHPELRIVAGIWGATENLEEGTKSLIESGTDEVVVSLLEAVLQLSKYSTEVTDQTVTSPLPTDDDARVEAVEALQGYKDRSANAVFDRMTKNLTRTFGVKIALLTLVDRERQFFRSQSGLPVEFRDMCDIPRDDSVCIHVVAGNATLVVEDLWRDRRFSQNPLVRKLNLRFYAGVPLHAANRQPIGSLCILDTQPRKLSAADQRLLEILAAEIDEEIALTQRDPPAGTPLAI